MARLRRMIYQKGAVGHIFQRARSGFVVFYSVKDLAGFLYDILFDCGQA